MRKNLAEIVSAAEGALEVTTEVINACSDAKGKDIAVLDVSKAFGLSDYFVVVSGRSDRQVQGIANRILERLEGTGVSPYSVEGFEQGHWIVLDFHDVVVHVFYEPLREHYDLENHWKDASKVEIKSDGPGGNLGLRAA